MTAPYYTDDAVTLYLGDMREVLPALGRTFDAACIDPPYGETSLAWDRWPDGWPSLVADVTQSMWCFGSMRMFLDRRDEFGPWKLSQDVVWEKHNGSGIRTDRFRRVHENAVHWYRGDWANLRHETPRDEHHGPQQHAIRGRSEFAAHLVAPQRATWLDDGTRLARSVIKVRSMQNRAAHPTEKPVGILDPLIRYACPPGGTVLDCFAGSGSTAEAARATGRRAVLIERHEPYCETIARRLAQDVLPLEAS